MFLSAYDKIYRIIRKQIILKFNYENVKKKTHICGMVIYLFFFLINVLNNGLKFLNTEEHKPYFKDFTTVICENISDFY